MSRDDRYPVAICAAGSTLFALASDSTVWEIGDGPGAQWRKVPALPQQEEEPK
jgi:hypothetical protein